MPATKEQREAAMSMAMQTKAERQRLKVAIRRLDRKAALESIAVELEGGNPHLQSMRLFDLLRWPRRVSETTVRHWLHEIRAGELKRVRELTARQLMVLVARLRKGTVEVQKAERPRWKVMRFECPMTNCDNAIELADHARRDPATETGGVCPVHGERRKFKAEWPLYERSS